MPRIDLWEFLDQPWLPGELRRQELELARTFDRFGDPYRVLVPVLADVLRRTGLRRIVDLASGAGGPVVHLAPKVAEALGEPLEVVLTDLYPLPEAIRAVRPAPNVTLRYHPAPVDAAAVPPELSGLRTLFSGLHHLPPEKVTALAEDAVRQATPLFALEPAGRDLYSFLVMQALPFVGPPVALLARPLHWRRLALSVAFPVVPWMLWWDGTMSVLRIYRPEEVAALWRPFASAGGRVEAGRRFASGARLQWSLGLPPGVA